MNIEELLMKALMGYDQSRARSQQTELGVSSIGGCRRKVWFHLQGEPKTNPTIKLPALMGTAIHTMIEAAITDMDWDNEYQLEREVAYGGLMGHIDLFIPSVGAVVDWKTTKKSGLDYFPKTQQRWQVQLYGYLLSKNGEEVKTVSLVAIPRDGDERQIKIHTEQYDEAIALEALAWLEDVKNRTEIPEPENYANFCSLYCSYFGDKCGGKGKAQAVESLNDEQVISAAEDYVALGKQIKELEAKQDSAKAALENIDGVTPSGITVKWSQVAGRTSVDKDAVEKALGYVPEKQGEPTMRLTVK